MTMDATPWLFRNTGAGEGEICAGDGSLCWRYRPPESWLNVLDGPLRRPTFLLTDPPGREELRIERDRAEARNTFALVRRGARAGQIRKRGLLGFRYELRLESGGDWRFEIPLFTVDFRSESAGGARVQVRLASELVWQALVEPSEDELPLIATLAFLQSERCRR
jgi:hypothetical protein